MIYFLFNLFLSVSFYLLLLLFEFDYSNSSGMNGINFGKGDLKLENGYLSLSYSGYYENNLNTNGEGYKNKNGYKVEEIEAFSVRTFT